MIQIECPSCSKPVRLSDELHARASGKFVRCPKCKASVSVPLIEASKPEPEPEPEQEEEVQFTMDDIVEPEPDAEVQFSFAEPHAPRQNVTPHWPVAPQWPIAPSPQPERHSQPEPLPQVAFAPPRSFARTAGSVLFCLGVGTVIIGAICLTVFISFAVRISRDSFGGSVLAAAWGLALGSALIVLGAFIAAAGELMFVMLAIEERLVDIADRQR